TMMFEPALEITSLIEVSAVETVSPSAAPLTTVGALVSSENFRAPCFDSIARRNSMPALGFFAFEGTTHDSDAWIRAEPAGILSLLLTSQFASIVSWKPGGILRPPAGSRLSVGSDLPLISLSSQEPTGMNAALPSKNACCDWRCERPSEPG